MKKEIEIKFKIAIHEDEIDKILAIDRQQWQDIHVDCIKGYLMGRLALQWVLSPIDTVEKDDFYKMAMYECLCHEATKIF